MKITLSYEICKKLKEAKFPQEGYGIYFCKHTGESTCLKDPLKCDEVVYNPTLEEMFEHLGSDFIALHRFEEDGQFCFYKKSTDHKIENKVPLQVVVHSKSLHEAMANFIIHLQENSS